MIRQLLPIRAALMPLLPALLPLLASSCGEGSVAPIVVPATSASKARTRAIEALEERIARLKASGHAEELLRSVRKMLSGEPKTAWFEMDGWSLGRHELTFIDRMNSPDWKKDREVIRALDFECPEHPLHVMLEYDRELEEHGIDLLIVPVPNRAQVWSDRLPEVSPAEQCLGGDLAMPRLLLEMSKAGLDIVDLYPAFAAARVEAHSRGEEADLFQNYNPHWSPLGVRVAAVPIAERIRSFDWFEPGPIREGEHYTRKVERLLDSAPQFGEAPDQQATLTFDRVLGDDGKPLCRRNRNSPILLLSDSYGGVYSGEGAGISSHLLTHMGLELDMIALKQGATNSVWQALARRGDRLKGKKLVIWLFTRDVLLSREMRKIEIFPEG